MPTVPTVSTVSWITVITCRAYWGSFVIEQIIFEEYLDSMLIECLFIALTHWHDLSCSAVNENGFVGDKILKRSINIYKIQETCIRWG